MIDEFLAELSGHAYGWPKSLRFTYDTVSRLIGDGVEGCMVECGVAAGVHPATMARACADHDEQRLVHLFDSFEGIPNGGPLDTDWNKAWGDGSGRLEPTGVTAHSLPDVVANLRRWGVLDSVCDYERSGSDSRVRHAHFHPFWFHVGWFQHTLCDLPGGLPSVAFLRLDGDLYESTKVCLEEMYPRVVSGGVVVVDDWNLDGCRAAVVDYFAGRGTEWASMQEITESGDVWWTKP